MPFSVAETGVGTPDSGLIVLLPLSSHTSVKEPVGKHFDTKPTPQGDRHSKSPPTGNLRRYDNGTCQAV
jgi:hypothetical protein